MASIDINQASTAVPATTSATADINATDTPVATGTRERTSQLKDGTSPGVTNPASLSADPRKKVTRDKPNVKPPLADVSMNRYFFYLAAGLLAVIAFYMWRLTVWADDAGGYWNLMTGKRAAPASPAAIGRDVAAAAAAAAAAGRGASAGRVGSGQKREGKKDVESLIWELAQALGVKPAELSEAIRPLVDPTAPRPEAEAAAAASASAASASAESEPGLAEVVGEIFLD